MIELDYLTMARVNPFFALHLEKRTNHNEYLHISSDISDRYRVYFRRKKKTFGYIHTHEYGAWIYFCIWFYCCVRVPYSVLRRCQSPATQVPWGGGWKVGICKKNRIRRCEKSPIIYLFPFIYLFWKSPFIYFGKRSIIHLFWKVPNHLFNFDHLFILKSAQSYIYFQPSFDFEKCPNINEFICPMHLFNKTTQNSSNNWNTSTSPTKELRTCLSLTTKTKRTKREQITKNMYNEINPCLSSYQTLLIFDICFYSLSQAHQEWYTDFIQYTIKRATLIHCLLNRNIVVYLFTLNGITQHYSYY